MTFWLQPSFDLAEPAGKTNYSHRRRRRRSGLKYMSSVAQICLIIIIIIIHLSWSWATCWPFPVSRIQKCLQSSAIIPCPASFRETCQWLKFPLNGWRAQSRVGPVVGLLPLASGPACLGMAFPPFLMKQLYRCDSVVISSFVRAGYTTRRWGWMLGRIVYSITHHYPLIWCGK